jgi:hypothetical protein
VGGLRGGAAVTPFVILPSDTTDSTFRCEHFRCTLAYRHCLRRQTEIRRAGRMAKDKTPRPVHPFCAEECAVGREVAAHFGKPEPVLLSLSGVGQLKRHAPAPPTQPKEDVMPTGKRREPCKSCVGRRERGT